MNTPVSELMPTQFRTASGVSIRYSAWVKGGYQNTGA